MIYNVSDRQGFFIFETKALKKDYTERTYVYALGRQNKIPNAEGESLLRPWPIKENKLGRKQSRK